MLQITEYNISLKSGFQKKARAFVNDWKGMRVRKKVKPVMGGACPPNFLDRGDILCHVPSLLSLKVCIWRGFKTKYDVCHVSWEEFFMLDHGRNLVGDTVSPVFQVGRI